MAKKKIVAKPKRRAKRKPKIPVTGSGLQLHDGRKKCKPSDRCWDCAAERSLKVQAIEERINKLRKRQSKMTLSANLPLDLDDEKNAEIRKRIEEMTTHPDGNDDGKSELEKIYGAKAGEIDAAEIGQMDEYTKRYVEAHNSDLAKYGYKSSNQIFNPFEKGRVQ